VSSEWDFHVSGRVTKFLARQNARDRIKLLKVFEAMAAHPLEAPNDMPRIDEKGRKHWLRFSDGFAIIFWIDHAQREIRVRDVGFE